MIGTPWWATVLIGVVTVFGAGIAAWIGASRTTEATRQREQAATREEWFRRLQWAGQHALSSDDRTRAAGLALMEVLARSPLAGPAELEMLRALNDNTALDRFNPDLDRDERIADHEDSKNELKGEP